VDELTQKVREIVLGQLSEWRGEPADKIDALVKG
jgi:hypothetical protein